MCGVSGGFQKALWSHPLCLNEQETSRRKHCRVAAAAGPAAGRDSRRSPERPRRAVASSNLALWKTARPACPLSPALGRAVVVPSLTRHGRDADRTDGGQPEGPACGPDGLDEPLPLRGPLRDALLPAPREERAAMFSFVYLKIITQKNIWRNVIFS